MEQRINEIIRKLKLQYLIFWMLPILLLVGFETNLLPVGVYADDPAAQYVWETIGILVVIICVPLSLKLFSVMLKKRIDNVAFPVALKSYLLWSAIRLGILEVAVLLNLTVYYMTLNNVGGLCALIGLTASVFCLPGEKRLKEELYLMDNDSVEEEPVK